MKHNNPKPVKSVSTQPLIESVLVETYYPCADKVLIVKDFLDKNFKKTYIDDINSDGQPIRKAGVIRLGNGQNGVQSLQLGQLLLLLDDEFSNMVADKTDRRRLMKQIIIDWLSNAISDSGVLSVNFL